MPKEKNDEILELLKNLYNSKNSAQIKKLVLTLQANNDNLNQKNQEIESTYITLENYVKMLENELQSKSKDRTSTLEYVKKLEDQGPKYYDSRL